jgi:predicted membrane chloride channel (bestrophin family)
MCYLCGCHARHCDCLLLLIRALLLQLQLPNVNLSTSGVFSISTFALSLLLVFRINSSYE